VPPKADDICTIMSTSGTTGGEACHPACLACLPAGLPAQPACPDWLPGRASLPGSGASSWQAAAYDPPSAPSGAPEAAACPPAPGPPPGPCAALSPAGDPKGVLLKHSSVVAAVNATIKFLEQAELPFGPGDSFLSYLPLAHIFDRCGEAASCQAGAVACAVRLGPPTCHGMPLGLPAAGLLTPLVLWGQLRHLAARGARL
jgi:hypothetical protein